MALGLRYSSAMDKLSSELPLPAIDGPWRADCYGAKLTPARNRGGVEELRLIDYSSFAIYGSFDDPALRAMVRHLFGQSSKQSSSTVTLSFDRFGLLSEDPARSEQNTAEFLLSLIGYGERYEELLREARTVWSSNGKYLVALIALSSEELSDPEIRELLAALIALSKRTVLRPIFLAENPRRMASELQNALGWQAFLGADRATYARDKYSMAQLPGMGSRIPIGVAVDKVMEESRMLNSFSYEPTEAARNRKEAIADEIASYERFLEGLTDGS